MTLYNPKDPKKERGKPQKRLTVAFVALGLLGGMSANALSLSEMGGAVAVALKKNTDSILSILEVENAQTAITPNQVGQTMEGANKTLAIAAVSENTARRVQDTIKDHSFADAIELTDPKTGKPMKTMVGAGLSSDLNCEALATKTVRQTKNIIKKQEDYSANQRLASLYTYDPLAKHKNRIARHLDNYCDITETAQGVCPLVVNGLESADSDYSKLYSKDALTIDDVEAATAFTLNVIDPISSDIKGCDTIACNRVTAVNTSYQAMSNVVQGAFVSQMNDRMYFEYQGTRAGKNLGKSTNIKDTSSGSVIVEAPSQEGDANTSNSNPTYFGDSIADGYKKANKGDGVTNVGDSPSSVYTKIQNYASSNPSSLKGKPVILSTGLSNDTTDYGNIRKQMELLKKEGADVQVLGVSNSYKGNAEKGAAMNKKLQEMASEFGFKFSGGFEAASDKIHPASYDNLQVVVKGTATEPKANEGATADANKATDTTKKASDTANKATDATKPK